MNNNYKRKQRIYNPSYLNFGFVPDPSDRHIPFCLFCNQKMSNSAMKPSGLIDHMRRKHPYNLGKPLDYFIQMKRNFENKSTLLKLKDNLSENDDGLRLSYKIANLIANSGSLLYDRVIGSSHSLAEKIILPSLEFFIKDILHKEPPQFLKTIPMSNNTICRRIDEMSESVEEKLISLLSETYFSIQLDETLVVDNKSVLMAYVRYFDNDCILREEMLFLKSLETDTTGISIFNAFNDYIASKNIPFENIVSCATDGAMAMVGKYRGFTAFLKKKCPSIYSVHCILHRHHLVAKNLSTELNESLHVVIRTVNKIKKNSKYDRLFQKFCKDQEDKKRVDG